jgi:hypothetical protein
MRTWSATGKAPSDATGKVAVPSVFLATAAPIGAASSDWFPAVASGLVVAIVTTLFQCLHERRLKSLEAKLTSRGGFFLRKLEKHEELWPLVARCNRAQTTLASQKRAGGVNLSPAAAEIAESRKALKNFVYDNGLYFDDEVRRLTQDLDTLLADPAVLDVRTAVQAVEAKLKMILEEIE